MIRISIDAPEVADVAGLEHVSTYWEVSKDITFTDDNLIIYKSEEDEEDLLSKVINYTIDQNTDETIYCRVKANFANESSTSWSEIMHITGTQEGFKFSGVIIKTPVVQVTERVLAARIPLGNFEITTSDFHIYSGLGSHESTTWIIRDSNDEIIWSRENDIDNLTSILTPKDILRGKKIYSIEAIHNTDLNSYSNNGKISLVTIEDNVNGEMIWHTGNMGHGGGLDADLLDTFHASQFLRSDEADTGTDLTLDTVRLVNDDEASLLSTDHAFQIGGDTDLNLIADNKEISARNNAEVSELHLNSEGGDVIINANTDDGGATVLQFKFLQECQKENQGVVKELGQFVDNYEHWITKQKQQACQENEEDRETAA